MVVSLAPTRTRKAALLGRRGFKLQQLGQGCSSGLMHGGAHRHLDGFQVQIARLVATMEDDT